MNTRPFALILAALLVFPAAGASWSAFGSVEPDTPQDARDGYMFLEPDDEPGGPSQVYFNGIATSGTSVGIGRVNQNVAGSRLPPPGAFEAAAVLGIWKDCNADGYMGAATSAMIVYRVELLPDRSICPELPHVNDGWVHELRWISPWDPNGEPDGEGHDTYYREPIMVVDPEVSVWGDRGLPGEARPASCDPATLGRGTTGRTGGYIAHADCVSGHAVVSALHAADEDGSRGLRFDDEYAPQNDCDHPLNRPLLLHNATPRCEGDDVGLFARAPGEAAVNVFDCTDPSKRTGIGDPNGEQRKTTTPTIDVAGTRVEGAEWWIGNEDGQFAYVPTPVMRVNDNGSVAQSVDDAALDIIFTCQAPFWIPYYWVLVFPYFVVPITFALTNPAILESPAAFDPAAGKRSSDLMFTFSPGSMIRLDPTLYGAATGYSPGTFEQLGLDDETAYGPARALLGDAPQNLGLATVELGYGWKTTHDQFRPRNGPPAYYGSVRSDLVVTATWATFYAHVGAATVAAASLPGAVAGSYGAEACGTATSGRLGGWDCDGAHWWEPAWGSVPPVTGVPLPRPGMSYQLRDIDCYDGAIASSAPDAMALLDASCPEVTEA